MERKQVDRIVLKKIVIFFLSFIGFLTTIKLAIIYYDVNFNPYALPSFCSINQFIDCDGVAKTTHSQFFGIPLSYWGMFLYLFIIFLVFVDKLKDIKFLKFLEVFKNPMAYISALGFISFLISMILAGISIFEIEKICILCICTYFLNFVIAIIANDFKLNFFETFKTSFEDFIDALKVRKYLISFLGLAFIAACFLSYTSLSYCFAPQIKQYKEFKKYDKMKEDNPFKIAGNILGDKNADLTVYIYTDYRCPLCRTYNVITHRAAQELGGFRIAHKNLPLDRECNTSIDGDFHDGACMLSRYSIAAENQGRFWELNSEFFEKDLKNEKDVLKLAKSMGFDTVKLKKDANSLETYKRLRKDIKSALDLKIEGTPTIVIKGKIYSGIKPYYELREILLKAGAFERKH